MTDPSPITRRAAMAGAAGTGLAALSASGATTPPAGESFAAILVPELDPHVNPLGVEGIGEIGTTGTAGAVANAAFHATGVRVREFPITLDKLLV